MGPKPSQPQSDELFLFRLSKLNCRVLPSMTTAIGLALAA